MYKNNVLTWILKCHFLCCVPDYAELWVLGGNHQVAQNRHRKRCLKSPPLKALGLQSTSATMTTAQNGETLVASSCACIAKIAVPLHFRPGYWSSLFDLMNLTVAPMRGSWIMSRIILLGRAWVINFLGGIGHCPPKAFFWFAAFRTIQFVTILQQYTIIDADWI